MSTEFYNEGRSWPGTARYIASMKDNVAIIGGSLY